MEQKNLQPRTVELLSQSQLSGVIVLCPKKALIKLKFRDSSTRTFQKGEEDKLVTYLEGFTKFQELMLWEAQSRGLLAMLSPEEIEKKEEEMKFVDDLLAKLKKYNDT